MKVIIDWKKDDVNIIKKRGRHEIIFYVPAYVAFHPGLEKRALKKLWNRHIKKNKIKGGWYEWIWKNTKEAT